MGKKPKADEKSTEEDSLPADRRSKDKKVRVKVKSKRNGSSAGGGDDEESIYSRASAEPKFRKIKKKKIKYKTHRDGIDSDGDYGNSDGETASLGDASRDNRSVNSDGVMGNAKRKVRRRKKVKKSSSGSDLDNSISSLISGGTGGERDRARKREKVAAQRAARDSADLENSVSSLRNKSLRSHSRSRSSRVAAIAVPAMSAKGAALMDDLDNLFPVANTSPRRGKKEDLEIASNDDEVDDDETEADEEIDPEERARREMQAAIQRGMSAGSTTNNRNSKGRRLSATQSGRPPMHNGPDGDVPVAGKEPYAESGSWRKRAEDSGLSFESGSHAPQPNSNRSKRDADNETVHSLTETVSSLHRQLDSQRDESLSLQKQLTEALAKVASLSEDLRREESAAMKTNAYLTEARTDLGKLVDEKTELTKSINTMEDDMRAKDERIEKLQQVVETQLDTLEFLEDKLEKTEDELFAMEDEFKALEDEGVLDKSVHVPKHRFRAEKMETIRSGRLGRKESLSMERQQSRRLLLDDDDEPKKPSRSYSIELAEREKKIENRERELLLQREDLDLRELRLEEWERELMEMDEQIKLGDGLPGDIATNKEKLLERRERRLEEGRANLQREKTAWSERLLALEREKLDVSNGMNMLEKEQQVKALKAAIENLEKEKAALLSRHEREDRLWDYPQQVHKLESENQDLRQKLEEARSVSVEDDEMRLTKIASMEDEIKRLRKKAKGAIDPAEYMQHMQDEIAEQLNELDDENQKLNDKLLSETERFEAQLKAKEEVIMSLEDSLDTLKHSLSSGMSNPDQVSSLMEELAELKKTNRELSGLDADLNEALETLEKKEASIREMENKLSKLDEQRRNEISKMDEEDGKDLLIRELQNQLVAAKKEAHELSSGDYLTRLKLEVKKLKQGYNDLKKRLKQEENDAKASLKEKDNTIESMEKKIQKLEMDLERRGRREKNLGTDISDIGEGNLQKHIEDLEDEIDHWKATNADLENELGVLKTEASDWKAKATALEENDGGDFDDDCSLGSVHSFTSQQSEKNAIDRSNHSFSSLTSNDLFFVSDSASVRSHRSSMNGVPPPPSAEEPSTPSQRALRTVSTLWSKVRNGPPGPSTQNNPAIPYGAGILDDD